MLTVLRRLLSCLFFSSLLAVHSRFFPRDAVGVERKPGNSVGMSIFFLLAGPLQAPVRVEVERRQLGKWKEKNEEGITASKKEMKRGGGNVRTQAMGEEPSRSKAGHGINIKTGSAQRPL